MRYLKSDSKMKDQLDKRIRDGYVNAIKPQPRYLAGLDDEVLRKTEIDNSFKKMERSVNYQSNKRIRKMDENDIKPKCYFVNEVPGKSKIDGIFERMGRLVDKEIERNREETQINRKIKKANRRIDPINCKPGPSEPAVKAEGRFPPHQILAGINVKASPVKGLGLQLAPSSGFSDLPTAPNSTFSNSKTNSDNSTPPSQYLKSIQVPKANLSINSTRNLVKNSTKNSNKNSIENSTKNSSKSEDIQTSEFGPSTSKKRKIASDKKITNIVTNKAWHQ